MPKHTRGKVLEHFEGVHRNCEAIKAHCEKAIILIADQNPEWSKAVGLLLQLNDEVDRTAQQLYGLL